VHLGLEIDIVFETVKQIEADSCDHIGAAAFG
jgi:hypothetical protein